MQRKNYKMYIFKILSSNQNIKNCDLKAISMSYMLDYYMYSVSRL